MTAPFATELVVNPSPYPSEVPTRTLQGGCHYVASLQFWNPDQPHLNVAAPRSQLAVVAQSIARGLASVTTWNPVALNASPYYNDAARPSR